MAEEEKQGEQETEPEGEQEKDGVPGVKGPRGLVSSFRRMDHTSKIFTLVGAGLLFQVRVPGFFSLFHGLNSSPSMKCLQDVELVSDPCDGACVRHVQKVAQLLGDPRH